MATAELIAEARAVVGTLTSNFESAYCCMTSPHGSTTAAARSSTWTATSTTRATCVSSRRGARCVAGLAQCRTGLPWRRTDARYHRD
eukprot:scaffold35790_cov93-Phaeocystis_antarctica.AAC.1